MDGRIHPARIEEMVEKAQKEVANKIVTLSQESSPVGGLDIDHGVAVATAFKGFTPEEFDAYIQEFKKLPMPHYTGMNRGDGYYLTMLQIVDFLKANGFLVYVISGTDRFIVRGAVNNSPLDLPPRQVVGSDERTMATGQGDEDGLKYTFQSGDEVVLAGDFQIKNL